jgi:acyl transferase domain-containing protein/3-hydroxymyristoyl/3-hydroxydecanoyl-(acyl carrier protein) dehydratase
VSSLRSPIAIVGQGCVLPGALDPAALWSLVMRKESALSNDEWQLPPKIRAEIRTGMFGRISGFEERFRPSGFRISADRVLGLDPVFGWALHAAREALGDLEEQPRGRVILGNLSYPTPGFIRFVVDAWRGLETPARDPRDRFFSGLVPQLVAEAIGFGGGGFALDAACASSLFAIELACRALASAEADVVVAGGVNHGDDLSLALGFTAMGALSMTGQSRPFSAEADGLVPAHGAAVVVLRRLDDARARGDAILGVIRGVGLSNDGAGAGFLVPSERGQVRAMQAAYATSGLTPRDISLVECHATGTQVGDATELRSTSQVFAGADDVPLGSLKSNLGHSITASGAAALVKVLAALHEKTRPPTRRAGELLADLRGGPLRLLDEAEPWSTKDGAPRRAAISNFGFGGNNAHLVVEEWTGDDPSSVSSSVSESLENADVAVIAKAIRVGGAGTAEFEALWLAGKGPSRLALEDFTLDAAALKIPPADLRDTLAQQLVLVRLAEELRATLDGLPRDRTSVLVGMQCDSESVRYYPETRLESTRDVGPMTPASCLGSMPNIVANRLNHHLGFEGPSYTLSADEASGTMALELAARELRGRRIDAAVVGAVDLAFEPVVRSALAEVLPQRVPSDAALLLVLKRLEDARRDGDPVLAVLPSHPPTTAIRLPETASFGHPHAASGLLRVYEAITACERAALPLSSAVPWLPTAGQRSAVVEVAALGGARTITTVASAQPLPRKESELRFEAFGGSTIHELRNALERREPLEGPADFRVAIVASSEDELQQRIDTARERLGSRRSSPEDGIFYGEGPCLGEVAFVFTGPAGAYPQMGRDLALGLPELIDAAGARSSALRSVARWIYEEDATYKPTVDEKIRATTYLAQVQAELTLGLLGIRPRASLGYSSGESNALIAFKAWNDLDQFHDDIIASGLFSRELGGELRALRRAAVADIEIGWKTIRVLAPVDEVRAALAGERHVHLTIVNGRTDVILAGDPAGCARVCARIGESKTRELDFDFLVHCPELEGFASEWRKLHHRPTNPVPGVRFYTAATYGSYAASADAAADALLGQALRQVDFPRLVEQAYADGVRVFVEHGPHAGCSKWISETLGQRPHLAVPLDRYGRSSLLQAVETAATLFAAGVTLDHAALARRLRPEAVTTTTATSARPVVVAVPAHPPPIVFPPSESAPTARGVEMPRAPRLPSIRRPLGQPSATTTSELAVAGPAMPLAAPAPPSPTSPEVRRIAELTRQNAELSAFHQEFLRRTAAVHDRFVRTTFGAWGGQAPATPASLPTPSPRVEAPRFDRAQLEVHAAGRISTIFGPDFADQDAYRRQVRMPRGRLLLVDRVTRITGAPGSMGLGSVWTETDVTADAWYLHAGRMPPGIFSEAGQADLFLISWLGVDALNRDERVYRLLGCDIMLHGELPRPGETLDYRIEVEGHASHGDVRLFFFKYDCFIGGELRLQVRNAQAGFFTDAELAGSAGILFDPSSEPTPDGEVAPPAVAFEKRALSAAELTAFSEGRVTECFGSTFARAETHTRTPAVQGAPMLLLHDVPEIDPSGGPWRRGYARARLPLSPDQWFFDGHFENDPCMPGSLMLEGGIQLLSVYLAAMGFTLLRDGWRFELVPERTFDLRCRGQATPASKEVVYELFVHEVIAEPYPTVVADVLVSVDGLKAFVTRRLAVRLVPDFPAEEGKIPALATKSPSGMTPLFDYPRLLAGALGRPTRALGDVYHAFDGVRRAPRLPSPPYLFMTRVMEVAGSAGVMDVGTSAVVEYDVPEDAWYFDQNGARVMPFSVLLEVALQPCGWLCAYMGCVLSSDDDLSFRNLDGSGAVTGVVGADAGTLTTRVKLLSLSQAGSVLLVSFEIEVTCGGRAICAFQSGFGFFAAALLENQAGLPDEDPAAARGRLLETSDTSFAIAGRYPRETTATLPRGDIAMLDRVTGLWPSGGAAGLGRIRAARSVTPADWFFKAHFFQDPVMPGSLGLEAMLQALQVFMLEVGLVPAGFAGDFEAIATDISFVWKYRGQIIPENHEMVVDLDITARDGDTIRADGHLWIDGKKIYRAQGIAMRARPREAR